MLMMLAVWRCWGKRQGQLMLMMLGVWRGWGESKAADADDAGRLAGSGKK